MKHILTFFLALVCLSASQAQFKKDPILNLQNEDKRLLNWGYYLGFNSFDFKFEYRNDLPIVEVETNLGFNVGLIGELRLNEFLDVRFEPGLFYSKRLLTFPSAPMDDQLREVNSTYISFPLLLKMSARRFGNWKPFVIAGGSTAINLGANEASLDDNSSGNFRMKQQVYAYELGFGIDFYLEYFKFSPSIRGVFTLNNELVPDVDPASPWTGNIEAMRTRGIFVNFTFE
ncbi:Outer membrane protein beta-barrel domain-containing protein [Robiginitalea myxolifaciens]|uniref:Outer membrane protein beta-barrel domain-containing protein n=1 Tax=Robiginitalea myxolifaciens TaxID=400055 RepID=A0A1I6FQJ0_9FLAO|nr:porin family protein [Robiginitalea myxolifaciens]SFR32144.1 Outer membrane protein beta-barrel domain-containing protein [Robiginitalea myxolifaciens]